MPRGTNSRRSRDSQESSTDSSSDSTRFRKNPNYARRSNGNHYRDGLKKWFTGCENFLGSGKQQGDKVHQTWGPLLCRSLYSNKAASSSSAVRSPLQLHHLDSGFSDSGESGNADGNSNGKEMHSEVVHETRTNSFDQR